MALKKFSNRFHIYVSVFFLPMTFLFALTGIVYISGINQDYKATKQKWIVEEAVPKDKQLDFLIDFLSSRDVEFPQTLDPRDYRGALMIGTAKYSATLEVKNNQTVIQTTKRSLLGNMIMLHKAKGKWFFDVLSIGFGIALILFYVSGVVMTAFCKKNRKEIVVSFLIGLATTVVVGYLSL